MNRADAAQLVGLLGALILVGAAMLSRRDMLNRRHRLWRWTAAWVGIFAIAALIATSFT